MGNKKKKVLIKQHLNLMRTKASNIREIKKHKNKIGKILQQDNQANEKDQSLQSDRGDNVEHENNFDGHQLLEIGNITSNQCNFPVQRSTKRKQDHANEAESSISKMRRKNDEGISREHEINEHVPLPYEIDCGDADVEHVKDPDGHRIVHIGFFFDELRKIASHKSLFNCLLDNLKIVSEKRKGLISEFKITCQMCQANFKLKTSPDDINKNATSGMMAAGCGYAQLNQFTAALDLPGISEHVYNKTQDQICNEWELTAWDEMKKAGERERDAALKEGRVNKDGLAMIDVELDGCWCKRSYKTNYSAMSGAATIIGRRFGQVLFMSVRNKYCCICARAEKRKETAKEHSCYKNFTGASTAMEASIIVEGFKKSIEMHNLIYSRFIADGDSSTYSKILEARPYTNITVEKINCKNHILRNFCNKLQQLKTDTKYSVAERKMITNEKIMSTRKYITDSMKLHGNKVADQTEKIKALHKDVNLSIYHGFGIHDECNKEICTRETEINPSFTNGHLWQRLQYLVANVASHARSLIENVDSNLVESFNEKFDGTIDT